MDSPSNVLSNNATISLAKRAALYIGILAFALVLLLFLGAGQASAEDISVDTTWESGSVINITSDVNVAEGVNLTVEENVTVVFQGNYAINVYGNLVIAGTEDNWTTFTYNSSAVSSWSGVNFYPGSTSNIAYLVLEGAWNGFLYDNVSAGHSLSNVIMIGGDTAITYDFYGAVRQDIDLTISGIEIQGYNEAFSVRNTNGSLDVTIDSVIVNDIIDIGNFMAHAWDEDGRIDMTIDGSEFTNSSFSGFVISGDILGDVMVTNTWFSHVGPLMMPVISMPPEPRPVMEMYGGLSGTSFTLDRVIVDNASAGFEYIVASGDVILTVNDCSFDIIGDDALVVSGDTVSSIQITNSVFTDVWGSVVRSHAATGDTFIVIDGTEMSGVLSAVVAGVDFGNIDLTVVNSSISGWTWIGTLIDLAVNSVTLDTGFVTIDVSGSSFSEAEIGFNVWCVELAPLSVVDTEFVNITGFGMYLDVRENDVSLSYDNVAMDNVGTGLWFYDNAGSLDLEFIGVHFSTTNIGALVQVSGPSEAELNTINMNVLDSVFEGGMYGIWAVSVNGGTVLVNNSQFLGQSEIGFNYESTNGTANLDVVDSVFDGSSEEYPVLYIVEQVEYDFELYGRTGPWDGVYGDGTNNVDVILPFVFEYNGIPYDEVRMNNDGFLRFDDGQRIRPIGDTELSYYIGSWFEELSFFGYMIAEDESYVLFNWYAMNEDQDWDGDIESNAFQVILYANGQIRFNYAAMDDVVGGDNNFWGLRTSSEPYIDYNLYRIYNEIVWNMDYTSFMFTPQSLSPGMGLRVYSPVGDIDLELTNNTITSYYGGGVFAATRGGDMVFSATENDLSYLHAVPQFMGPAAVVSLIAIDGTMDVTINNNVFERLWTAAVVAWALDFKGGEHSFEVTGNQFNKVVYGVYTTVIVLSDLDEEISNATLGVVANFQDNIMTDSYGLGNSVYVRNGNQADWTVNVEQTFTGNVMEQVRYEGEWPFNDYDSYVYPSLIEAILSVDDGSYEATDLVVDHVVTITDNEMMQAVDSYDGITVESVVEQINGTTEHAFGATVTGNTVENFWGYLDDGYYDYLYGDGIDVYSYTDGDLGSISADNNVVVEGNTILGAMSGIYYDYAYSSGIYVDVEVYSDGDRALDVNSVVYISVSDNYIEELPAGAEVYLDNDMENTVGVWVIDATVHVDRNEMFNVTYGVEITAYDDLTFYDTYWPYYSEVALGNHTFDYVVTVDDNVILSNNWNYYDDEGIIDVEMNYESWVYSGALFTEAKVLVTGTISISGNEITQVDNSNAMIALEQEYESSKTGDLVVNVDVVIQNNVLNNTHTEMAMVEPAWFGILIEEQYYLDGSDDIPTDEPSIVTDVSWSVTGNQLLGPYWNGIGLMIENVIESPDWNLVQNGVADLSGNTVDFAIEAGLGVATGESAYGLGYTEVNLDVTIENNLLNMTEGMSGLGKRSSTGLFLGPNPERMVLEGTYGIVENVNALIAGNTVIGGNVGLTVGSYEIYDDEAGEEGVFVSVWNVLVENNHISDSMVGVAINNANATIQNNDIENCGTGISLTYAGGDLIGNTISAQIGISLTYPGEVSVVGNQVSFVYDGVYVRDIGAGNDWTGKPAVIISGNTFTYDDSLMLGPLNMVGGGVVLEGVGNVVVEDNTVDGGIFGIFVNGAYNLTLSGNTLLNSWDTGVYLNFVYLGWVESNVVMYSGSYGVFAYDGCWYLTIGNNTIADGAGTGLEVTDTNRETVIYNNDITGNSWGMDVEDSLWIIDGAAKVARNGVWFDGAIEVRSGGTLAIQDVSTFDYDGDVLLVMEGGLLSASNSNFVGNSQLKVYGTLWANLCLFEGYDIYLGPTSEAEIRGGAILWYEWAGIHVDGASAIIADNLIMSPYAMYGILVEGEGATSSIISNIIALNDFGVYGRGTDMGGVYDNLIVLNVKAGVLGEEATGRIHDNILLANKVEILLRDSDVSVEDNEIGYTDLFQVLANYAPILGHFVNLGGSTEAPTSEDPVATLESVLGISGLDVSELATWIKAHNGIWAENSTVRTSGNQYGLLNYAMYAVDSEIHFADDVRNIVVNVPHANEGEMYNYSFTLYTLNGLYAARSDVYVDGSTIEVLDDAIVMDASNGWVEGATLLAGDFDYFVFGGSEVYNIATSYTKAKVMDSHSLNEGTWLTITFLDKGEVAANISVVIMNAKGVEVFNGTTDADGKVRILLIQYSYTSEGKDDGFNPYTVIADFESGEKSTDVVLNESYQDLTIEGEEESDMGAILAVVGVLVIILLIVAAVVVMRRRK